ncbi:hypothetical protein D910_03595 [Dendroctonus ponderosae]|uniref:Uncharacterized protein n=1 Tax=Dendroctonus ponderosae TaxID=77166 RepID=U4TZB1_DENPD|nr:hypothetical protein D910_03595 [Dendroctonus ponderosae]
MFDDYRSALLGYICWYDECTCCPYGYHIDLDFVRYCESISKEDQTRTGSIKRRKDRRKQRQSMEVMLGLATPTPTDQQEASNKINFSQEAPKIVQKQTAHPTSQNFRFNDGFDDAVSDFERALQRSKHKLPHNLPDVTAVSENLRRLSSVSPTSVSTPLLSTNQNAPLKSQFDMGNIESCGLSPAALQNIREALALSLDRMKQLEFQVKLIPDLQDELKHLRIENIRLQRELKLGQNSKILNGGHIIPEKNRKRSQSFTEIESFEDNVKKESSPLPRKDFGVMCGVLTRTIGVGHQYPNTKHASTITTEFADKWMPEKAKFLNSQPFLSSKITIHKGTQTFLGKEKRDMGIQTSILHPTKITVTGHTQTDQIKPIVSHVGSLAVPKSSEIGIQKNVECLSVGTSNDAIDDVICEKCRALKKPQRKNEELSTPVSLAALSNRSKSFSLGEDRLDHQKRTRTVASQYETNLTQISKASQVEFTTRSKSTQHDIKIAEKNTQYDVYTLSKFTDTKDLIIATKPVYIEKPPPKTVDRASSPVFTIQEKEVSEEKSCDKCTSREMETSREFKKDSLGSPTPSRIPIPTTPIEARKFRRQDTYTKIYSPTEKSPVASHNAESVSPFDKVKQNFKLDPPASSSSPKLQKSQLPERSLPVSESTIFQPPSQNRKKAVPSKEMQGALKVLNDSLHKSPSRIVKNQSAINIVQQEWFKISSLVTANPQDVEDFLDAFEDMSSLLLQYVVNMTDVSGNTAMHYAVSHGNFDVVSILLDSKVCDINKPNKAGYTSVMLVSLSEVRSPTHANVVRRLFQLADVNIRASQYGQTALMLAVSHGRIDTVKMLLEAGADINIQDEDGSTALMCAAEHGHIDIVKHFLSQPDCDSSITDVDGSTALKIAMEAGHRHIGVLLYAHERTFQKSQPLKLKKTNSLSPKTPSSPLPIRSSHRALTDTKK